MSWRELWDFVAHLPPGSAIHRALWGPAAHWTPDTHAIADVYDLLAMVYRDPKTPLSKVLHARPDLPT